MKRINFDYPPRLHTDDDLRFGEDIIIREGRIEAAPSGEQLTHLNYPNLIVLGSLNIGEDVLIFCRSHADNNINDTEFPVVYYSRSNNTLVEVIGRSSNNLQLNFGTDAEISSTYRINTKSEIEVAFTDGVNKPYFINIGKKESIALASNLTTINDIYLFPEERVSANLNITTSNEGGLTSGVYFVTYKYFYTDGKLSSFNGFSEPIVITNNGTITINITHNNLPTYDGIEVYVMKNGEVRRIYRDILNKLDFTITYSNENLNTNVVVSLENLTINSTVYDRVGSIGVVDNRLLLGDVTRTNYDNVNLQPYVNNFQIRLDRREVELDDDSSYRTFMPGEVYALYAQPQFVSGEYGKAYNIPARTDPNPNYDFPIFQFQLESYPSTGGFKEGAITHHRIPSEIEILDQIRENANWAINTGHPIERFGHKFAYIFGFTLIIPNNTIPANIAGNIKQWRLLYAKKTIANSRVVDNCHMTFMGKARSRKTTGGGHTIADPQWEEDGYVSAGGNHAYTGNFEIYKYVPGDTPSYEINDRWDTEINITRDLVRLHSPQIALNKIRIPDNCFLAIDRINRVPHSDIVGVHDANIPIPPVHQEDANYVSGTPTSSPTFIDYKYVNYNQYGTVQHTSQTHYIGIKNYEYALSGTTVTSNNLVGESCMVAELVDNGEELEFGNGNEYEIRKGGYYLNNSRVSNNLYLNDSEDFLFKASIINPSRYLHTKFWKDELITTSAYSGTNMASTNLGADGDCFLGLYTEFYSAPYSSRRLDNSGRVSITNDGRSGYLLDCGVKAFRKMALYSRYELSNRNQTVKDSIFKGTFETSYSELYEFMRYRDTRNSQQVLINETLSKLNTYEVFRIYFDNVFENDTINFPFRLHLSEALQWRNFLPLQTQDLNAEFGAVINLQTWGDKTIIHQEFSLWLTRDKVSLQSDEVAVYVGTTNFLAVAPQQILPESTNIGLDKKHKAILTKVGYAFISRDNKVYLFSDKLEEISSYGMRDLFNNKLFPNYSEIGNDLRIGYNPKEERLYVSIYNNTRPAVSEEYDISKEEDYQIGQVLSYRNNIYRIYRKALNNGLTIHRQQSKQDLL